YVFSAVRAGASGFLLKDVTADELCNAVRIVAGGNGLIEPRMTRRLMLEFARLPQKSTAAAADLKRLTEREMEVLLAVAQGLSNAEIADQLFIGETTVKTHVTHILAKLQLRDRVQAVVMVLRGRVSQNLPVS
ncbi:MAG: response regulator transcription factor, partial [Actinomycetota bacterium]